MFKHRDGHAEIGYYPIRPTTAGLALVETWPECVYQWHREGFDRPPGAELLAEATLSKCRRSASVGASRCNFIPTSPTPMMHRWTTQGHERMALPGAKPAPEHFADRAVYDYSARAWLSLFLERWIGT